MLWRYRHNSVPVPGKVKKSVESVLERVESVKECYKELRRRVILFVQSYYEKKGEAPSTREILSGCGTNWSQLYKAFPGKLREICEEAEVPFPEKRMSQVEKATNVLLLLVVS